MTLLQTQIKVEPCISAGPKAKKKGAFSAQGTPNGGQHQGSAQKASTFKVMIATLQSLKHPHIMGIWTLCTTPPAVVRTILQPFKTLS